VRPTMPRTERRACSDRLVCAAWRVSSNRARAARTTMTPLRTSSSRGGKLVDQPSVILPRSRSMSRVSLFLQFADPQIPLGEDVPRGAKARGRHGRVESPMAERPSPCGLMKGGLELLPPLPGPVSERCGLGPRPRPPPEGPPSAHLRMVQASAVARSRQIGRASGTGMRVALRRPREACVGSGLSRSLTASATSTRRLSRPPARVCQTVASAATDATAAEPTVTVVDKSATDVTVDAGPDVWPDGNGVLSSARVRR